MGAEDVGGGLLKDGEIEGEWTGPDEGGEHGGTDGAGGVDAIFVGFAGGAVAGMEVGGGVLDGENADAGRKGPVEGSMEVGRWDGCVEGEGCYLGEGVDSGIGAA